MISLVQGQSYSPSTDPVSQPHIDPSPGIILPNSDLSPNLAESSDSQVGSQPVFDDLDVPIALRKGKRNVHPISNYMSYTNLSENYEAFTSELTNLMIPRTIQEALQEPKWCAAVMEELGALKKNRTWNVVNLPKGKKVVGCKWVFTVKFKANGEVERYKTRLATKGFAQTQGII